MPAISMTLKQMARTIPGSTASHRYMAKEASASSAIIPAPPTTNRCHLLRNAEDAEAST